MALDDMNPEEFELAALSSLHSIADIEYARSQGVDDWSFATDTYLQAWSYMADCASRGVQPNRGDLKLACGVELLPDVTDKEMFVQALMNLSLARRGRAIAHEHLVQNAGLPGQDAVGSLQSMLAELGTIRNAVGTSHSSYYDSNSEDRLNRVKRRIELRESGEMFGIPTGLMAFDKEGDYWKPGELVVVIGPLNSGKSWLLAKMAAHAYWINHSRVLFLSPESTIDDTNFRLDVLGAQYLGAQNDKKYGLSHTEIQKGLVDYDVYQHYIEDLQAEDRSDWITRDSGDAGVFSLDDVISATREVQPDLLVVDGVHLIRVKDQTWESMKAAAEAIKGLAQDMGITVLVGSQVQREAVTNLDNPADLGQVAYGMGMVEAANRVISLGNKRGRKDMRVFTVPKNRDGPVLKEKQYLLFNVDVGEIRQMDAHEAETGMVDFV